MLLSWYLFTELMAGYLLHLSLDCLLILPRLLFYINSDVPCVLKEYFIPLSLINPALFTILPGAFSETFLGVDILI